MNLSTEALDLLLLFLPGVISSAVLTAALRRRTVEPLQRLIEAVGFTLAVTAVLALIGLVPGVGAPVLPAIGLEAGRLVVRDGGAWSIPVALALSVLLPLPIARVLSTDTHMALLRRLGVSQRTSRASTWEDVFAEQGDRFVVLELRDGRRLQGYTRYWSDDPAEGLLYVTKPAWLVRDDDERDRVDVVETGQHGLMIHRDELRWIEFQHRMPDVGGEPAEPGTTETEERTDG